MWVVFDFFLSSKGKSSTSKIKKQQTQKLRKILFFFPYEIVFRKKISTIKPCFSSLLVAYMGGFYEFHVLSIVKDYIIKALWEDC